MLRQASNATGIQATRGEHGFDWRVSNEAGEPRPPDLDGQRSDLTFQTRTTTEHRDELGEFEEIRVDFGITAGGRRERMAMEQKKRQKYERILQFAQKPFVFVPAIMNTRGTFQRECESLLRFISQRHQFRAMGAYSNAATKSFLGQVQARCMQREYTMLMLAVGADSRDPDVVFRQATIASGTKNSSLVTLEGTVAQRARNRELAIEADFVRELADSAEDDGPEAAVDAAEDAAIDVEAD